MSKLHCLKTWPKVYGALADGRKTAEFRKNDRFFSEGDMLILQEYWPEGYSSGPKGYTGNMVAAVVQHVLQGPDFNVPDGYVVMSIRLLK